MIILLCKWWNINELLKLKQVVYYTIRPILRDVEQTGPKYVKSVSKQ